jgi:hypothetical protein
MENTTALNGTLCVTTDICAIEIAFNGTEKQLWKQAASKVQELRSLGLLPIIQFKDVRETRQLQIEDCDIDMILSM